MSPSWQVATPMAMQQHGHNHHLPMPAPRPEDARPVEAAPKGAVEPVKAEATPPTAP